MPIENSLAIICPRAKNDLDPIIIDLKMILEAEARIQEISSLTPQKAPELLSFLNRSYLAIHEYIASLMAEKNQAEKQLSEVKGCIVLDKMQDILRLKGLSSPKSPLGSEDTREAVIVCDTEYQKALDKLNQIQAILWKLEAKGEAIKMAFYVARNISVEPKGILDNAHRTSTNGLNEDSDFRVGVPDYSKGRY